MSEGLAVGIHVDQVEDGSYLATFDELPGLVAQGLAIQETIEIVQDVARKLMA
ncbi:MAG: type II toxin-antitoxin system HicB family antitoxin [Spirochaetaceae bacterium]